MGIRQLYIAESNRLWTIILIGLCAIFAIGSLIEGAREHRDARIAEENQEHVDNKLDDIRKSLSLGNAAPAQVLSAAAAKLQEQEKRIKILEHPAHDLEQLYEDNIPVASVGVVMKFDSHNIEFDAVTTVNGEIDFDKELEFRDWRIRCSAHEDGSQNYGTTVHVYYTNVACSILGRR